MLWFESPCALLIVGTIHLDNPGRDLVNVEVDDVLSPTRQAEIEAVADGLARFEPTKVAVEAAFDDARVGERYEAYCRGDRPLERSEVEQIGYRVANGAGHPSVYGIDVPDTFWDARFDDAVRSDTVARERWEAECAHLADSAALQQELLEDTSIGEVLVAINEREAIRAALRPYLDGLTPVRGDSVQGDDGYVGAEMVSNWYRRNLKIYANLCRIVEPGDRVLVVYGQGHVALLREFAEVSANFAVADALDYLEGAGS